MGSHGFEMAASWKIFTFHTMGPRLDESSKFHEIVGLVDVDVFVFFLVKAQLAAKNKLFKIVESFVFHNF